MTDDENARAIKSLETRIEELDWILSETMSEVTGGFWPAFAVAMVLVDAGVAKRERMLEIIEAVHDLATAQAGIGVAEHELQSLENFRFYVDRTNPGAGSVLTRLREFQAERFLEIVRRPKPPRRP
ncbi:hypothetical protein [Segnochrobactrum spirostomi]|uniref:Uncharacterized protein n=1 Tax=Segnochrobactrum spirostomi TaxID=2608987 RepID=A0A6A7Y3L1_9HYPH|nr:hypothetical protein [Segnochrobactrum spirostomi]MQT13683.1 hypothetical protein [Segnochrobactrum spirostomi]